MTTLTSVISIPLATIAIVGREIFTEMKVNCFSFSAGKDPSFSKAGFGIIVGVVMGGCG